jgi:hypothetical protein
MGLLYRRVNHTISRRRAARWCVVLNRARPGLLLDLTWVKRGGHSPSCLAVISSGSCRQLAQHLRAVLENPDLPYLTAAPALGDCPANRRFMHIQSSIRDIVHAARPPCMGLCAGHPAQPSTSCMPTAGRRSLSSLHCAAVFIKSIRCRARKTILSPALISPDSVHRRKATLRGSMRRVLQNVSSPNWCCSAWQLLQSGTE